MKTDIRDALMDVNIDGVNIWQHWIDDDGTLHKLADAVLDARRVAPAAPRDEKSPADDELRALAAELHDLPNEGFVEHGGHPRTVVLKAYVAAIADRLALLAGKEPT